MTIYEARLIREVKRRCTYRYLAEVYYCSGDVAYGIQMEGYDLCIEAFKILYPKKPHPCKLIKKRFSKKFIQENKSKVGDFYWWE